MKKIVILLSLFLNVLVLSELGLNKPLSTNGEANFDKIVNKKWLFDDTEIIIKKDSKGNFYSNNSSLDYDTGVFVKVKVYQKRKKSSLKVYH